MKHWFERWNALTDAPETHAALAALYAPDGLHLTGPDADQRGTATFRGPDGVRALAARIAAAGKSAPGASTPTRRARPRRSCCT